ncbi:MAG: hypothetical protein L0Y72_15905 [Gemmataceae bacterium]|nr:hypothetical protein [Gemmataceae bacterium]MCI0740532.1 hypothetical protein [Gemmataceae bacterium]
MRGLLVVVWLLIPVGVGAYHFGPGQERLKLDDAARWLGKAENFAAQEDWVEAESAYEQALKLLPNERVSDIRRLRLERAKAQMLAKKLPIANQELQSLVAELRDDPKADPKVLAESRSALANSQYYLTWLMRLEGLAKDDWEPEIESARQTYRLLAEQSDAAGDSAGAKKHREDLESAVRLARMDLSELQGLPLPSQ